jgi:hypothetical protein
MRKAAGVSGHQRPFVCNEISAADLIGVETRILYLEQGRINAAERLTRSMARATSGRIGLRVFVHLGGDT